MADTIFENWLEKVDSHPSDRKLYESLSDEELYTFYTYLDWDKVSTYSALSETFMNENKEILNWILISMYQTLSEEFILSNKDYVDWESIFYLQVLSEDFIKEQLTDTSYIYKFNPKTNLSLSFVCLHHKKMFELDIRNQLSDSDYNKFLKFKNSVANFD